MNRHSIFIAPASSKAWFDSQAETLGNGGPALVLTLSATGHAPATHGWCAVQLDEQQEAAVAALIEQHPEQMVVWRNYDLAAQPGYPDELLAQIGLKRINEEMP